MGLIQALPLLALACLCGCVRSPVKTAMQEPEQQVDGATPAFAAAHSGTEVSGAVRPEPREVARPDPKTLRPIQVRKLAPLSWTRERRAWTRSKLASSVGMGLGAGNLAFVLAPTALKNLETGKTIALAESSLAPFVSSRAGGGARWRGGMFTRDGLVALGYELLGAKVKGTAARPGRVALIDTRTGETLKSLPVSLRRGYALRLLGDDQVAIFDGCKLAVWKWREHGSAAVRWSRCSTDKPLGVRAASADGHRWVFAERTDVPRRAPTYTVVRVDIATGEEHVIVTELPRSPTVSLSGRWTCWPTSDAARCFDTETHSLWSVTDVPSAWSLWRDQALIVDYQTGSIQLLDLDAKTERRFAPRGGKAVTCGFIGPDAVVCGGRRPTFYDLSTGRYSTGPRAPRRGFWERVTAVDGRTDVYLQALGINDRRGARDELYLFHIGG